MYQRPPCYRSAQMLKRNISYQSVTPYYCILMIFTLNSCIIMLFRSILRYLMFT